MTANKQFARRMRLERPLHELSRTARYTRYVNPWPARAQWVLTGVLIVFTVIVYRNL